MKILISTMKRCVSTALFNVCRLLLENIHGKENVHAGHGINLNDKRKILLNKNHVPNENLIMWSDTIITGIRDLRYVIASCADFSFEEDKYESIKFDINNDDVILNRCREYVRNFSFIKKYASYVFKYERFIENDKDIIIELKEILQIKESIDIENIINQINLIKSKIIYKRDEKTEMHPNHVSKNTDKNIFQRLTIKQIKLIENNFGGFLLENGYSLYR